MDTTVPYAHPTLITELSAVEKEVAGFFGALSSEELFSRVGEAWSPAEHLAHLTTAVSAVARGFSLAPWLLRLRFGRSRNGSRPYSELRDDYRGRLAAGGKASGPFVPPAEQVTVDTSDQRRSELLMRWSRVNVRLRSALAKWSEQNLDAVRMPHPILGKITAREMIFFTIYHGRHHIAAAGGRLARFQQ